jgi:hypothetical protein
LLTPLIEASAGIALDLSRDGGADDFDSLEAKRAGE